MLSSHRLFFEPNFYLLADNNGDNCAAVEVNNTALKCCIYAFSGLHSYYNNIIVDLINALFLLGWYVIFVSFQ